MTQIVCNKVQCLNCNDIIESRHRHDFVTCKCGNTSVDGGHDYLRRLGNTWKDLSVTTDYPFEEQRDNFSWKTYGLTGNEKPRVVPLSKLTSDHIKAILRTQIHVQGTWIEELLKQELEYRNKQGEKDD